MLLLPLSGRASFEDKKQAQLYVYRQHPWFTQHLPRYLAVMQADTVANASVIDQDLVDDVATLGFDRDYVVSSLTSRLHNKVLPLTAELVLAACAARTIILPHTVPNPDPRGLTAVSHSLRHAPVQTRKRSSQCAARTTAAAAVAAVLHRHCVQATVAYHLIADNKRRMPSSAYLKAEMTEAKDAAQQLYPSGKPLHG